MLPSTGELFEARVSFPAILTGNQIVALIASYPILPFQWPFDKKYFPLTGYLPSQGRGRRGRLGPLWSYEQLQWLLYLFLIVISSKSIGFNYFFLVCFVFLLVLYSSLKSSVHLLLGAGASDIARFHCQFDCNWDFQPLTAANGSKGK